MQDTSFLTRTQWPTRWPVQPQNLAIMVWKLRLKNGLWNSQGTLLYDKARTHDDTDDQRTFVEHSLPHEAYTTAMIAVQ